MNPMAMLNNPQAMQEMMSSPLVQGLLSDPEMIRSMMQSNPQLQAIISANPEMGAVLNDPAMMRQAMDMMRNPSLMQEQMRHMDRQLHNIEGMPDGFNRLRSMYESVQEPMINALVPNPAPVSVQLFVLSYDLGVHLSSPSLSPQPFLRPRWVVPTPHLPPILQEVPQTPTQHPFPTLGDPHQCQQLPTRPQTYQGDSLEGSLLAWVDRACLTCRH